MFDGCEKYPVTPLRGSPESGRWPSRVFTVSGGGARSEVGLQKAWQEMDVCVCRTAQDLFGWVSALVSLERLDGPWPGWVAEFFSGRCKLP